MNLLVSIKKFSLIFWFGMLFIWLVAPLAKGQQTDSVSVVPQSDSVAVKPKPVKNTFESVWVIDNQTVMVPIKRTFEMDINHRFGIWKNGYEDFYGLFASSNIRMGFNYAPINKLFVGVGITKYKMLWDANVKYVIFQQMKGKGFPLTITYYGNAAIDSRDEENFLNFSDRMTYFNQLLIARKVTERFSAQVAPSHSHTNVVNGYYSEPGVVSQEREHDHFAVALSGRFKFTETLSVLANYDQPITEHTSGNPNPNLSLGLEINTSSHAFQIFAGNYYFLSPQQNNMYNSNDYSDGEFLIGFNITRLWNY